MEKIKLWKVTTNSYGYFNPVTSYFGCKEAAAAYAKKFAAADPVKYAGCFTFENALEKVAIRTFSDIEILFDAMCNQIEVMAEYGDNEKEIEYELRTCTEHILNRYIELYLM